jgi:hypothetical protein
VECDKKIYHNYVYLRYILCMAYLFKAMTTNMATLHILQFISVSDKYNSES